MADDVHWQSGIERGRYQVYAICAQQFGWDKEQVDRQKFTYLKKLLAATKELASETMGNVPKPMEFGDQRIGKVAKSHKPYKKENPF